MDDSKTVVISSSGSKETTIPVAKTIAGPEGTGVMPSECKLSDDELLDVALENSGSRDVTRIWLIRDGNEWHFHLWFSPSMPGSHGTVILDDNGKFLHYVGGL